MLFSFDIQFQLTTNEFTYTMRGDDNKEEEQPYGHEIKLKLKFHI